jgi:predicted transposase YdaD
MRTDTYFYRLFKQLPETYFELIGLPSELARRYRFDSVELKKSYRVDGVLIPTTPSMPVYFAEVQFQPLKTFYANLFAKVFSYLEENDPGQEWFALALFANRSM